MKNLLALIVLCASIYFIVNFFMKSDEKIDTHVLRVATEGNYMPWNGKDDKGKVIGFDADLSKAICKELSMKCKLVTQDWDSIIPNLLNDQYDIIVAAMAITNARRKQIDFSDGYADPGVSFASSTLKRVYSIKALKVALKGKVVGVQVGTVAEKYARKAFEDSVIRSFSSQDEINLELLTERIDAAVNDHSSWLELMKNAQNVRIISPILKADDDSIFGEGFGIGLKKGRDDLKKKINDALNRIRENGVLTKLSIKWLGYDASLK